MAVEKPAFTEYQMRYLEYLRRYRKAGEPENRLRLPLFTKYLQRLAEGEFLLSALVEQHKKGSKAYITVLKDQAELRVRLLLADTLPELEEAPVDMEPAAKIPPLRKPRARKPNSQGGGMVKV